MYCNYDELFNKRESAGVILKKCLNDRKCTKIQLSQGTGISRPTIDKLINGTISNKKTFVKHMMKIIEYLNITLDYFMTKDGMIENKIGNLQRLTGLSNEHISNISNLDQNELIKIDTKDCSNNEIIKLALSFSTSTNIIENNYFFNPQFFNYKNNNLVFDKLYQFWGYIGIKLNAYTEIKYYPITFNTMEYIYKCICNDQIIIPCLNNKVLFLNMKNIQKICFISIENVPLKDKIVLEKLLDKTYPLVIYELLSDEEYKELDEKSLTDFNLEYLTKSDKENLTDISSLYYKNGEFESMSINFKKSKMLLDKIISEYKLLNNETAKILEAVNMNGIIELLNFDYLCMIEMPLIKLERNILELLN